MGRRGVVYKALVLVSVLSLLAGFSSIYGTIDSNKSTLPYENINTQSSTSPSSPVLLTHDSEISEWYPWDDKNYYYKTMDSIYLNHVVWVAPYESEDDYDLYLYADASYTQLLTYSAYGPGLMEWVVFTHDQDINEYHPLVYVHSGSVGEAWVEWDVSNTLLTRGQYYDRSVAASDRIEIYDVYLMTSESYDFHLIVPLECDLDLYLYRMPSTEPEYLTNSSNFAARSILIGNGTHEVIENYVAPQSGRYLVLILNKNGGGSFTFSYDFTISSEIIPSFTFTYLVFGLLALVYILRNLKNKFPRSFIE